jgi:hypothetical protein
VKQSSELKNLHTSFHRSSFEQRNRVQISGQVEAEALGRIIDRWGGTQQQRLKYSGHGCVGSHGGGLLRTEPNLDLAPVVLPFPRWKYKFGGDAAQAQSCDP